MRKLLALLLTICATIACFAGCDTLFAKSPAYTEKSFFDTIESLKKSDIQRIETVEYPGSVDPYIRRPIEYKTTTLAEDIETVYIWLKGLQDSLTIIPDSEGQLEGAGVKTFTIYISLKDYFTISDVGRNYLKIGDRYYEQAEITPNIVGERVTYQFESYNEEAGLYINDQKVKEYAFDFDKLFCIKKDFDRTGTPYTLTTSFGKLYLYDAKHFVRNNSSYEIISEFDFSQIFKDFPTGSSCAHTYEWIARSGYGHQMIYTCGCPYDDGIEAHKDNNDDYQCDVCGWPMDGILPEIYPILYEFETWIWDLSADNVKEIKTTAEYVGVEPGTFKNIQRTTDKDVIAKVIADYRYNTTMQQITREEALVPGGSAFTIEFILTNGEVQKLDFNNGVYTYNKPALSALCYFKMDRIPTLKQYTNVKNSYSFITYFPTYDLFTVGGEKVGKFDGLDRFEFIEYREPEIPDGEVAISPGEATHYIVGDIGTMYICSDTIFYMIKGEQRIYYQLVGEEHFDDICYNDSLYKVTIVDKNNRFFDKPTEAYFKAGARITLHCRPIMDADLVMYINGERVATQYVIDSEDGYLWEYSFVVPAKDVTITFQISGGM